MGRFLIGAGLGLFSGAVVHDVWQQADLAVGVGAGVAIAVWFRAVDVLFDVVFDRRN